MPKHTSHDDISKRLKRANGHLKSIITMLEDERSCSEIAQQLHAVEKAISRLSLHNGTKCATVLKYGLI
jgi:DNA-binding FrmR family transcriptional regulator